MTPQKSNKTTQSDGLKKDMEKRIVHSKSDKPTKLKATDIHVPADQEKHLPQESWHVVRQKQGRVQPAMKSKGDIPLNVDIKLEREADEMVEKALRKNLK